MKGVIINKTKNHYIIRFNYDSDLIIRLRLVPSARYDFTNKFWLVETKYTKELRNAIEPNPIISGSELLEEAQTNQYETKVKIKEQYGNIKLYKHQIVGAGLLIERERAILADDMGLGKTYTALAAAKELNRPTSVIAPASLLETWSRSAKEIQFSIRVYSWAKVPGFIEHGSTLIVDEAHYAQSLQSKRTKAMLELCEMADYVWLLTGTPMKNGRPINLFPLLRAIRHPLSKRRSYFEFRYCDAKHGKFGWDNQGAKNLDELQQLTKNVIIRRTKRDCLDLPEKTRILLPCEVSEDAKKIYDDTMRRLSEQHPDTMHLAIVALGAARQAASLAKVPTAVQLAKDIMDEGNSVVIFTAYVETAKQISKDLNCNMIIGEVAPAVRTKYIDNFQKKLTKSIVLNIQTGGLGITLTAANYVLLVDRAWTPGDCVQAEDRLHRIGQHHPVTSYWLQAFEVDEYIDEILLKKMKNITKLMQVDDPINFIEIFDKLVMKYAKNSRY